MSHQKKLNNKKNLDGSIHELSLMNEISPDISWMEVSSSNNLVDVHKLHVKKEKGTISKKLRDVFVTGTIQDIRDDFQV